ncbi:MAG: MBOAT family O-acyltransferase [Bacteroidota bacterium]
MTFNSPLFLIFLAFTISINYLLPQRFRYKFLVLTSLVFIGFFNLESLTTLVIFSLFNFYIAKKISGNRLLYLTGISFNVVAIVLFNYFNLSPKGLLFFISTIHFSIDSFIIALGLSFYTLQNIAYLTEVYFQRLQPEKNISKYILYCSFFPKIISGPVMLPNEFLPQIDKATIFSSQLISGFQRILLGLFKKMVIADRLAPAVSSVFDYHNDYSGLTTLIAAYLFTIQLYFDFSGYTDMALGTGKMLGYDLKENFNTPLRSTSISEFWRRWHISLISWFSNYIYYPIVYRLRNYKKAAVFIGILLTFLISGIWHGIGFTFLAWAACHAIYLSFELLTKRYRLSLSEKLPSSLYKASSIFIVFNAVCFSNIFFRAESMGKALQLIQNIFSCSNFIPGNWLGFISPLAVGGHQMDEFNFYISILITILVLIFERKINKAGTSEQYNIGFIILLALFIMMLGIFNNGTRFIYMQF